MCRGGEAIVTVHFSASLLPQAPRVHPPATVLVEMFARITFFAIFAVALAADPLCQSPCQFGTSGPCRHTTGLCFPYPGAALHCDRGLV